MRRSRAAQEINRRVREVVETEGLSPADLAKLTGWSEKRAYRVLTGMTMLTAYDMRVLARVLATSIVSLYRAPSARAS